MASEAVDIAVGYDNYGQLVSITFECPWEDGAYMNLYGNVYYSPSSSIGYGIEAIKGERGTFSLHSAVQCGAKDSMLSAFTRQVILAP